MNKRTRRHISRVGLLTAGALLVFGSATITSAPSASAQAATSSQGITLNLQNAPVQTVLRDLFKNAGKNFTMDPNVSGTVTVDVNNVPFDQALSAVLGGTYPPLAAPMENGGIYHVEYASQQAPPAPVNVASNNNNNNNADNGGTPSTADDPRHFYPPIRIKHYDAYDMALLVAMFGQKGGMPTEVPSEPLAMSSGMGGGMMGGRGGGMGGGMMGGMGGGMMGGMGGGMMGGMGGGMMGGMGGGMGGGMMGGMGGGMMGGGMMGGGMGGGMMGGGMGGGMMGGGMGGGMY